MSKALSKYEKISSAIYNKEDHISEVSFIKKDGSTRVMRIKPSGIKSLLVGESASESAKRANETRKANNPNLLAVYDLDKQSIRSINMDTLVSLKVNGEDFEI